RGGASALRAALVWVLRLHRFPARLLPLSVTSRRPARWCLRAVPTRRSSDLLRDCPFPPVRRLRAAPRPDPVMPGCPCHRPRGSKSSRWSPPPAQPPPAWSPPPAQPPPAWSPPPPEPPSALRPAPHWRQRSHLQPARQRPRSVTPPAP